MKKTILKSNSALDHVSMDQLDIPVEIKSSKAWIAWLIVLVCLLSVLAWSMFGVVNVRVEGPGMIVPAAVTMFNATSEGSGTILSVECQLGDYVKKGQVIATVDVKEFEKEIAQQEQYINKLIEKKSKIDLYAKEQNKNMDIYSQKLNSSLDKRHENSEKYQKFLSGFISKEEHLKKIGAISALTYEETVKALYEVENELFEIVSQRASSKMQIEDNRFDWIRQNYSIDIEIMRNEQKLVSQKLHLEKIKDIRAPIEGIVTQIYMFPGSYAQPGKTVATITSKNEVKSAIAFLPTKVGKRVDDGMIAFISPSIAEAERYGTIPGKVESVSDYPMDSEMLSSLLKDHDLAVLFSKEGPPIYCKLSLAVDPSTPSGFAWTSGVGPFFKVTDGNICDVSIVVERRRPITYVMPFLREWLGLEYE